MNDPDDQIQYQCRKSGKKEEGMNKLIEFPFRIILDCSLIFVVFL